MKNLGIEIAGINIEAWLNAGIAETRRQVLIHLTAEQLQKLREAAEGE
jgi:hypothetical protein